MGFFEGLKAWLGEEVKLSWGEAEKKDKKSAVDEERLLNHKIDVIVKVLVWYFVHIDEEKWIEELVKGDYVYMDEALKILETDALKARILSKLVRDKKIVELIPKDENLRTNSFEVMRKFESFKSSLRLARSRSISFEK